MLIGNLVVNVQDRERAAHFWSEALGYRLRDGAIDDDEAVLVPQHGTGVPITLDESER